MLSLYLYISAFFLDFTVGDPPTWPHPVRVMGHAISGLERVLRRRAKTPDALYLAGAVLWLAVVGGSAALSWCVLSLAYQWHSAIGALVELWMAYTVLATRSLNDAALAVMVPLLCGDLSQARYQLSMIVGRDTERLDSEAMTRATIETVAENTVDGVIAPLFYLFIGGVPLAMAYKAVNTLDSMVGYHNARYRQLGCVAAKLDDVANWIPARISWLLMAIASGFAGGSPRSALTIGWRDRRQHASPNSGWPEATVAGALGVRLGGPNYYFGEWVEKPWLGDAKRSLQPADILLATRTMWVASLLALALFSAGFLCLSKF